MKKAEFIEAVATKAGLSKKDAAVALSAVLDSISDALKDGKSVNFIGFGSFTTTARAARETKVPLTGQSVKIPARRVVKFKTGKSLKETVA
ncbi:MAG: DNA-binding protein [Sulfurovum sp. AS07-7]|jgi:DNA-binding protein HU-beta|nr:MAG: DNA-binding protein [Sulfurovum sp. AS07-7]TQV62213.1 MAG: HU family DNA-binding protein [Sulfurovum sp.]